MNVSHFCQCFKLKSVSVTHFKRYIAVFYLITWVESSWSVYSPFSSQFGILPNTWNFKYFTNFYRTSAKSYSFLKRKCFILQFWAKFTLLFFVLHRSRLPSSIHACAYVDSVKLWKIFPLSFFYLLFYDIFSRDDGL